MACELYMQNCPVTDRDRQHSDNVIRTSPHSNDAC